MSDFYCMDFEEVVPITKATLVDSATIQLEGTDVREVTRALINGVDSPNFVIVSRSKLNARIPLTEVDSPITSLSLVGKSNKTANVNFTLKSSKLIDDSTYVVQRFMRCLIMDPGSDIFNPNYGVGLLTYTGSSNFEDIELIITSAIRVAESQVKQTQSVDLALSKSLSMVEVLNVSYSINTLTASVGIKFTMADGSTVATTFSVLGY